ncbi:MAG: nitroreductase family protein, partial [Moraxellaceae bacterium]|nr:nitroreductase family protein [Moraxellaceae bacterium]
MSENSSAAAKQSTVMVDGKPRYHEPAPQHIDVEAFRQVVISRRSVRKFTSKPIPKE